MILIICSLKNTHYPKSSIPDSQNAALLYSFISFTTRAGTPAAIVLAGTSFVTRSITNRDAWQNSYVRAKPNPLADMNRCWQQLPSFGWILLMVQSRDHSVVANQSPVANIDSALVLDGVASINEHVLANMDIFPQSV